MQGTRLVISLWLRERVLSLAIKTKNRLRSKVWWSKMDADAEKLCRKCHRYQVTGEPNKPEPHFRVVPPSGSWKDCAIDLLGSLPSGESILVIVDYFDRFFEIAMLKSVRSDKIICASRPNFARFGLPISLKNNNGPQLVSHEFKQFLTKHNNEQVPLSPLVAQGKRCN